MALNSEHTPQKQMAYVTRSPASSPGPAVSPRDGRQSLAEIACHRLNPGQPISQVNLLHFAELEEAFQLVMSPRAQHVQFGCEVHLLMLRHLTMMPRVAHCTNNIERWRHPMFTGIANDLPLKISQMSHIAPFDETDYQMSIRDKGIYICGANLFWANPFFTACPGVPINRQGVRASGQRSIMLLPNLLQPRLAPSIYRPVRCDT